MSTTLRQQIRLSGVVKHNIIAQYCQLLIQTIAFPGGGLSPFQAGIFLTHNDIFKRVMVLHKMGFIGALADVVYHGELDPNIIQTIKRTLRNRIFKELSHDQRMELGHKDRRFGCELMYRSILTRDINTIEMLYNAGIPLPKVPFRELNIHDTCNTTDWWLDSQYGEHNSVGPSLKHVRKLNDDGTWDTGKIVSVFDQARVDFMGFLMRHDMILYDTNINTSDTDQYSARDAKYSTLDPTDDTIFTTYALHAYTQPVIDDDTWGDDTDTVRYYAPEEFAVGSINTQYKHIDSENIL